MLSYQIHFFSPSFHSYAPPFPPPSLSITHAWSPSSCPNQTKKNRSTHSHLYIFKFVFLSFFIAVSFYSSGWPFCLSSSFDSYSFISFLLYLDLFFFYLHLLISVCFCLIFFQCNFFSFFPLVGLYAYHHPFISHSPHRQRTNRNGRIISDLTARRSCLVNRPANHALLSFPPDRNAISAPVCATKK